MDHILSDACVVLVLLVKKPALLVDAKRKSQVDAGGTECSTTDVWNFDTPLAVREIYR